MRALSFVISLFLPFLVASQQNLEARFDSVFSNYFSADDPGGAVLVAKDGIILYEKAFGIADMKSGERVKPSTLFNVGSITKTFVAYGILKLAAAGRLNLNDNLYQYFPEFRVRKIAKRIKLFHLLTHSSGLPDLRRVREERAFYLTAKDKENFAPLLSARQLEFEPGFRFHYSNPAFNGLALVIEKVTGQRWQTYIEEQIFKPAGMEHSTITDGPHPASGVAHAYVKKAQGSYEELDYGEEPTFAAAGNGGVWSSVEELWKYELAIQRSSFLDSAYTRLSRTVFPLSNWQDSVSSRLGLSWFLTTESGEPMVGHTGSQGGFVSDYCWFPGQRLFYVLLCNVPKPIKQIRESVIDMMKEAGK